VATARTGGRGARRLARGAVLSRDGAWEGVDGVGPRPEAAVGMEAPWQQGKQSSNGVP
jgi:hypothetical protein